MIARSTGIEFHPLTADRWDDFAALFGKRGACGGCWCMWWRLTAREYDASKGAGNRRKMKRIVGSGSEPGILAYIKGNPAGWCAVAPRSEYPRLAGSRILKPVDDEPVWSIVCLYVAKGSRKIGLSTSLVRAAVQYAAGRGATVIEAYPVEPKKDTIPDAFAFHGLASSYSRAGFKEVARRSETRPVMRYFVSPEKV